MNTSPTIALSQSMTLPVDPVADWVHLLPAGTITTQDGRGPYRVEDAARLIADSLQAERGGTAKLPIDENHAIDLAAPRGEASPSRGWIVELQAREDGIWGRVDWTATGRALLTDRAYLALSPAIAHDATGRVLRILRASLVNRPNLRGLTALHQEDPMSLSQRLAALLGLQSDATEDVLIERVTALHQQQVTADQVPALQAQLNDIGVALGMPGATQPALVEAARALHSARSESQTLTQRLAAVETQQKRERADAWMAAQIAAKRMISADKREGLIALHMQDPDQAEQIAALYPSGGPAPLPKTDPASKDGKIALQAEQREAVRLGGFDPEAYAAVLKSEQEEAR